MDPSLEDRYLTYIREGISAIEKGIHGLIMNDCEDVDALENIRRLNNVIAFMTDRIDSSKPQEHHEVDLSDEKPIY